jgi:hypothetical protein
MREKFAALMCLAAVFLSPATAFQWPVEQKTVIATFGQSFIGDFHRGVGIAGQGAAVRPIEPGELVFYRSNRSDPADLPSALGSFVVIEHENKIRSLYGHIDLSRELLGGGKTSFGETDILGVIGDGGFTAGARLFLMVIDTEVGQVVNPYLILPLVGEKTRPTVANVTLTSKNATVPLPASEPVAWGPWEVSAQIYDASPFVRYFCPMAPYRAAVYLNGQEAFQMAFDALKEKEGVPRIYPSADLSHDALYAGEFRMKLGTVQLKKGIANLEIIVRDFAGNERAQSFQFRVN